MTSIRSKAGYMYVSMFFKPGREARHTNIKRKECRGCPAWQTFILLCRWFYMQKRFTVKEKRPLFSVFTIISDKIGTNQSTKWNVTSTQVLYVHTIKYYSHNHILREQFLKLSPADRQQKARKFWELLKWLIIHCVSIARMQTQNQRVTLYLEL